MADDDDLAERKNFSPNVAKGVGQLLGTFLVVSVCSGVSQTHGIHVFKDLRNKGRNVCHQNILIIFIQTSFICSSL